MNIIRRVFDTKGSPILAAVFVALFIAESRRPLRKRVLPRWKRVATNSIVSIPSFSFLRFLLLPVMIKSASLNQKFKLGLNNQHRANVPIKTAITFLLLDYTNYLWHVLLHKLPILWRFHLVHHCDPDLDVTTALRFHFGELIGSVFYRGAFVFLSGASPLDVLLYEIAFESATQFHHSNWRLPVEVEKGLNKIFVTPRMHGTHHSVVSDDMNSNFSVIFSFWDRLHSTINLKRKQENLVIGINSHSNYKELTAGYLLEMPFNKIKNQR